MTAKDLRNWCKRNNINYKKYSDEELSKMRLDSRKEYLGINTKLKQIKNKEVFF